MEWRWWWWRRCGVGSGGGGGGWNGMGNHACWCSCSARLGSSRIQSYPVGTNPGLCTVHSTVVAAGKAYRRCRRCRRRCRLRSKQRSMRVCVCKVCACACEDRGRDRAALLDGSRCFLLLVGQNRVLKQNQTRGINLPCTEMVQRRITLF